MGMGILANMHENADRSLDGMGWALVKKIPYRGVHCFLAFLRVIGANQRLFSSMRGVALSQLGWLN